MWRVRIRIPACAVLAALAATAASASGNPYAYRLAVAPEEGPVDREVEARKTIEYGICAQGAVTTRDSSLCLEAEFPRQDKALNAAWKFTFAHTAAARKAALLTAQRKWLVQRDPFCRSLSDEYSGGTIAPVIYVSCRVELTIRRTLWLEGLSR